MAKINYTHRTSRLGRPVNAPTGRVRKKLEFSLLGKKKRNQVKKKRIYKKNKNKNKKLKTKRKTATTAITTTPNIK